MFNYKNNFFLVILAAFFILIFVSGCQYQGVQNFDTNNTEGEAIEDDLNVDSKTDEENILGQEKDEHNCLVSAGYSWCEIKNKCIRTWEEKCQTEETADKSIVFEKLEWKEYKNDLLGYSLEYPSIVNVMGNDLDQHVEFNGPLLDNEWWPKISISHYNNNFYRPDEGVDIDTLVKPFPEYQIGKKYTIAGLKTIHYVQKKTPQAWATDYFYFIKDNQLYNITIIHGNDREDWRLYDKILNSFTFAESGDQ